MPNFTVLGEQKKMFQDDWGGEILFDLILWLILS